jgi:inner membrane protein
LHPQFDGAFLPDTRHVSDTGFEAQWKILEHNRNIPQQSYGEMDLYNSSFGVELIRPVDIYQTSERAVKYSILFIILTFLVFFFTEVLIKKRAHPVQYLMAGAALCVFFSLLIALSEHIGFTISYLIASSAIILMISLYTHTVFKLGKVSLMVGGVLVVLFAFLFVALQLEDYSLLFGNIGLVLILAVVMYVSRKVDWFNDKKVQESNQN